MFVTDGESNYDRVFRDLLAIVHESGAAKNASFLGGSMEGERAVIPLFGRPAIVEKDAVTQDGVRIDTIGSILVLRYLLCAGKASPAGEWVPYRAFRDGSRFASYIKAHIEDKIAAFFSGKQHLFGSRLESLGASIYAGEIQADLIRELLPLPRVPVLCLFRDRDDEFEATFQFLFDASAPSYLDLEALAVVLQYTYLKVVET
jgi:hypothetical protein